VSEDVPPAGVEPLEWFLLTTIDIKGLLTSFACLKTNPLSGTGKGFVQGPKKGILSGCNSKVQGIRGPQGMLHGHNPFRCPFKIAGAYE